MTGVARTSADCDVIVIGGGIIGCAIAREVARRGARTVLVEARAIGRGATQASAGVLAPFIEAPGEGPLQTLTVESLAMYDQFIVDLQHETRVSLEYRRCGTLEIAHDAESVRRLKTLGDWARSKHIEARWLDPAEVAELETALAPTCGGLLVPAHGYVRAAQLTDALEDAARGHGVVVHTGVRVERLSHTVDGVSAIAADASYHAQHAVIAAGSWSGEIAPETNVTPVRGQLLYVAWRGSAIGRILWSDHCYIVPWLDGTLLIGATVERAGFDERVTGGGVQGLLNAAIAVLPGIADATFIEARVGLRPGTITGLPVIRRSTQHPSVVYATGHFRNGILLAPLTARLVADLIC